MEQPGTLPSGDFPVRGCRGQIRTYIKRKEGHTCSRSGFFTEYRRTERQAHPTLRQGGKYPFENTIQNPGSHPRASLPSEFSVSCGSGGGAGGERALRRSRVICGRCAGGRACRTTGADDSSGKGSHAESRRSHGAHHLRLCLRFRRAVRLLPAPLLL